MTVYISLHIVYYTTGVHYQDDYLLQMPNQPRELPPGYVVHHTPCGITPHSWYGTAKISVPSKCGKCTTATYRYMSIMHVGPDQNATIINHRSDTNPDTIF